MKKLSIVILASVFISQFSAAQDLKQSDNKLKLDKAVVAQVEKKKGNFTLTDASGKSLIFCEQKSYNAKLYRTGTTADLNMWYVFHVPELSDSIQLKSESLYKEVNVPLFGPKDETFAKLYFKLGFVTKEGTLNLDAIKKFREKYNQNITQEMAAKEAEETMCTEGMKEIVKRDIKKDVVIKEIKRGEVYPSIIAIEYEIRQDDVLLGTVEVKAHPKALEDELAEYEYSEGIVNLGKDYGVAEYKYKNSKGCLFAVYITTEKNLFTYKDYARAPGRKIAGKTPVKTRVDFITVLANHLVKQGYL